MRYHTRSAVRRPYADRHADRHRGGCRRDHQHERFDRLLPEVLVEDEKQAKQHEKADFPRPLQIPGERDDQRGSGQSAETRAGSQSSPFNSQVRPSAMASKNHSKFGSKVEERLAPLPDGDLVTRNPFADRVHGSSFLVPFPSGSVAGQGEAGYSPGMRGRSGSPGTPPGPLRRLSPSPARKGSKPYSAAFTASIARLAVKGRHAGEPWRRSHPGWPSARRRRRRQPDPCRHSGSRP
jgi:hypothetical protein